MSASDERPFSGGADFEAFAPDVVMSRRTPLRPLPSRPVPDLSVVREPHEDHVGADGPGRAEARAPRPPAHGRGSFHAGVDEAFDVVAIVDAQGRFLFVSASAERLLGFSLDDVVGRDALDLFDDISQQPVRALFSDLVARRRLSVSLEVHALRADGRPVHLELLAVNHLEDPIGGILVNLRDITERTEMERRVSEGAERQASILDAVIDGVIMIDARGVITAVNQAFEVLFHAPRARVLGQSLQQFLALSTRQGVGIVDAEGRPLAVEDHPHLAALLTGRRQRGVELGLLRPGGQLTWMRVNAQPMVDVNGFVIGAVATWSDTTEMRRAEDELRRDEQFLQVLLDTLEEGIVACDAEGRITVFNPAARRLHGLADDENPLGRAPDAIGFLHADGAPVDDRLHPLRQAMEGMSVQDVQLVLESIEGSRRKVSVNGRPLVDQGVKIGAVVAMHDVTEQKRNEERLAEMALHDPLTGLANRTLLAERLNEAIAGLRSPEEVELQAPGGPGVAVFLLDLDEFKEINDTLGHDVGDDVLLAVARRLQAIVRPTDTVARLGGDEFVVVCAVENGEEEMTIIADRIAEALDKPYRVAGRTMSVGASVGGVFAATSDTDPSKLLSGADDAMYGIKWSRRRNRRSSSD